jgi:peptide/nickel transport system substrate-binding protein
VENQTKNVLIAVLLVVVVAQSAGLVYFWTAGPGPVSGKVTLTVGTTHAIARVPHPQTVHGGDDPIVAQIFEGLFDYVDETLELEPVLATDMGTVSADGLEYTFTLRQGVKFHDGTDFNATAVKDHFDLIFEVNRGMTYILTESLLNKTEIIDDYTVKFTLNTANSAFRDILAHISFRIPSPTSTAAVGDNYELLNQNPVGTGPFKFVSKIIDNELVMEANQDWWRLEAGESIQVDQIVWVYISDPSTMKLAIEQGDIDVTQGDIHVADYESLLANPNLQTYDRSAAASSRWLCFNMNSSKYDYFDQKLMRQAFAYAIPYDEIISVVFDGEAERLYSYIPPEYVGYKAVFDYEYNATKALELIDLAGFSAPVTVDFYITPTHYGTTEPDVAALIAEYADDAGFDLNIIQSEYNAHKERFYDHETEVIMWRWSADFPDTYNWNNPFMQSTGWAPRNCEVMGGDMSSLYPNVDNLINEAAATTNQTRKLEILEELQETWNEYLPSIFLWRNSQYQFSTTNIDGLVYGAVHYDIRFQDVVVNP